MRLSTLIQATLVACVTLFLVLLFLAGQAPPAPSEPEARVLSAAQKAPVAGGFSPGVYLIEVQNGRERFVKTLFRG